jgi:hypothetical protein
MYKLRVGGSNDFVSKIDPDDPMCVPPGSADYVPGWDNPDALVFETEEEAQAGADLVLKADGVHVVVEEIRV